MDAIPFTGLLFLSEQNDSGSIQAEFTRFAPGNLFYSWISSASVNLTVNTSKQVAVTEMPDVSSSRRNWLWEGSYWFVKIKRKNHNKQQLVK